MGMAYLYPEKQEVDPERLLDRLRAYDAWALSCDSLSLRLILPMCPNTVRVAAWCNPGAAPFVEPVYSWEPVIFHRPQRERAKPRTRDWLVAAKEPSANVKGAKPHAFGVWLFSLLGLELGDSFDDLFPGSGSVSSTWGQWQRERQQLRALLG